MTKFDRNNPAICTLKERFPLSKDGSSKQTWHITLDIEGRGLEFQPGDSVGVYSQNDPVLVSHFVEAIHADPKAPILHKRTGEVHTLENFLTYHANLNQLTSKFLKLIHECENCPHIEKLLSNKETLRNYLSANDPLGLLRRYQKTPIPLQKLADQFGPLLPRFYSVASCGKTHPNILDLTVALFTWVQDGQKRYGVASHFLCNLATPKETPIQLFVQPAPHFRLPQDGATPIIMIGPGTGIAPFRAFLQERQYHGATGNHWLFFGERNRHSDFFYENEWSIYPNLRIETAFSRDQSDKIYVQHVLKENAMAVCEWLEKGAHLYICGDAQKMAKDVESALAEMIQTHHNSSEEDARAYLKVLKKEKRYLLDVY